MLSILRTILKTLLIILVPLILVLGSVRLLTTDSYLTYEYGKANFPADDYGFSPQLRFILASTNVHYVLAHLPENELSQQTLNGTPVYNGREISHMVDVRAVFQNILFFWRMAILFFVIAGFVLWRSGQRGTFMSAIQWGGFFSASFILTIALLAFFAWQTWFEVFHQLFFLPGSWLFSYQDTLIRLFPFKFWFDATLTISFLTLVSALLLMLLGWRGQLIIARQVMTHN